MDGADSRNLVISQDACGMVRLNGGSFKMGSNVHYPEEAPARTVTVAPFLVDRTCVTNAEFSRFVAATAYVTFAEKAPDPAAYPGLRAEMLAPGSIAFVSPGKTAGPAGPESWWRHVRGASWRRPYGPDGPAADPAHPVVQVVWEDAVAFAAWAGKRLPTEIESEFAARGGLEGAPYAWGEDFMPDGRALANVWRSGFPFEHPDRKGPPYTTPVGAYPANRYGLFDTIGNVWEWTSTDADGSDSETACCSKTHTSPNVRKVLKGGSHLCAPNYCRRYRPAARWFQPTDTSTTHVGFRCVRSAAEMDP